MSGVAVRARVVGLGVACPVGLTSVSSFAAIEAGINRFEFVDGVIDRTAQPVSASRLAGLPETRLERAVTLGAAAIRDAVEGVAANSFPEPIPCLLGSPEPTAGGNLESTALTAGLRQSLLDLPVPLHWPARPTAMKGRAAFFDALQAGLALLATRATPAVLVGATDSLADASSLRAAAAANRVQSKLNLDGNVFGEGAAFALLVHPHYAQRGDSHGEVLCLARDEEPRPIGVPEPSTSLGLAAVFRSLRAAHSERVGAVFCGVSCEGFYGMEFSNAYLRNVGLMPEPLRSHTIGNALGDVGAGAGAIAFAQSINALAPRRGPAVRTALAYASSDSGGVGGCIVQQTP